MDFLGTNEPEYDPNRCTTMSFSHQPYDLNAVEPKEIKQWIDAEQPRETRLFIDYKDKPFMVHCKHCLKIYHVRDTLFAILALCLILALLYFLLIDY
ncbi:unnamed protein product [Oikopleura dioica]|uniref:Uncharacterized protein n=1 Tax=Oikopleura dioica TaxID=34765 RepID=E4XHW0_OIKDI|nr:unnamed protein product [Oikopleura dioica]